MTRQEQLEELEKEWMSQDKILAYPNWLTDQLLKLRAQRSALMEALEPIDQMLLQFGVRSGECRTCDMKIVSGLGHANYCTIPRFENLKRVYEQVKEKI